MEETTQLIFIYIKFSPVDSIHLIIKAFVYNNNSNNKNKEKEKKKVFIGRYAYGVRVLRSIESLTLLLELLELEQKFPHFLNL